MADGSLGTESKSKKAPSAAAAKGLDSPDIYPGDTQFRLCSVAMALGGAAELFNEINDGSDKDCGVAGILDLAVAELTRITSSLLNSK